MNGTKEVSKPSKRYCMVVEAYYPLAETRVQREAEALLNNGYEVDVICMRLRGEAAQEVVRGVNVYRLPVREYWGEGFIGQLLEYLHFFILAVFTLIRLHAQKKYGVVQVHNLPDFLVFCTFWPKLTGARVILDIHDVMPEFFAVRTGRSMDSWLVRMVAWQERLSCAFADHVITVTELWRQALIERGIRADKVSVLMNVADANLFHRGIRTATASPQNGSFRLIYHGSQTPRYGLDVLLCAIAQVRSKIPGLRLTLHGNGDCRNDLIRQAKELQLDECVEFSTRFLSVEELPQFIAKADVGVVPYLRDIFTDGILPTKLMEYVALGLPVIVSRTPVIENYFDESMVQFFEAGNVDSLAASIFALYQDQPRREALIQHSAEFVRGYSWTNQSANYVQLVNRLNEKGYQDAHLPC